MMTDSRNISEIRKNLERTLQMLTNEALLLQKTDNIVFHTRKMKEAEVIRYQLQMLKVA